MSGTTTPGNDTITGSGVIRGEMGNDVLTGANVTQDSLYGGAGNDVLTGNSGSDLLRGGFGDDSLSGGLGNDTLRGADGNDTMRGGDNADTMYGGAGADVFFYGAIVEGFDLIIDFVAEDQFQISAAGFKGGLTVGMDLQAEGRFITVNAFGGSVESTSAAGVGQFIFDADGGNLFWDANGGGGDDAQLVASVETREGTTVFTPGTITAADLTIVA